MIILKGLLKATEEKMKKTVEAFKNELKKVRTGRAHVSLLDDIKVDAYDSRMPINHLATVSAPQPDLLVVQPFDKNLIKDIEKAILKSDLGLNPVNDGNVIKISIPKLTEERRKELARFIKKLAEEYRQSIRNARRDSNEELKKKEKEHQISEDDLHRGMKEIQNLTDDYLGKIEEMLAAKEKEIMGI